jgi:hypothetical protein
MIDDMKDNWDSEALCTFQLAVDENNNTTIIIDDVFGFVTSYENSLVLLEVIFTIARRHSLNWKLKKCDFFPKIVEFVGHDLTKEGNLPADSKSTLLESWPKPSTIRDISSFLGFTNFYSRYIPFFKQRIRELRHLIREKEYSHELREGEWTDAADSEFHDIRDAILSKPLLQRVLRSKRLYLGNFSKIGMGFWTAQPGNDEESLEAMRAEDACSPCLFELTLGGLRLFACSFGCRACLIPVSFGQAHPSKPSKLLNQTACGLAAFQPLQQNWIVYGFTSGHFFMSCKSLYENITVHLAADTNKRGRSFLKSFGKVHTVVSSAIELLQQVRTSYTL